MCQWLVSRPQTEESVAEEEVLGEERLPDHLPRHGKTTPSPPIGPPAWEAPPPTCMSISQLKASFWVLLFISTGETKSHSFFYLVSYYFPSFFYFEVFTWRVKRPIRTEHAEEEEKEEEKEEHKEKDDREKGGNRRGASVVYVVQSSELRPCSDPVSGPIRGPQYRMHLTADHWDHSQTFTDNRYSKQKAASYSTKLPWKMSQFSE